MILKANHHWSWIKLAGLLLSMRLFLPPPVIQAESLESNSYVVQFGTFNMSAGEQNSSTYNVTNTLGQLAVGPYGQYGSSTYFVGSGFQYIYQIKEFAFTITDIYIDLGTLTSGVHNTDTSKLTVAHGGANGYVVYAYELHPLRLHNGAPTIPDTTCNAGDCTQIVAKAWTNQAISGFGFNVSGEGVPADFINSTYFRQFADNNASEAMQPVMLSDNVAFNDDATVTYKAGPQGAQAAGTYETTVVFIAVPGF